MEMAVHNASKGPTAPSARPRKKILWVSKHRPYGSQFAAMRRAFGNNYRITFDSRPFTDARDIAERFRRGEYDELILVGPLAVSQALLVAGLSHIRAVQLESGQYGLERFEGVEIKSTLL